MAIVLEKPKLGLRSVTASESKYPKFKLPDPGDVFLLAAFIWATLCFMMVVFGQRNITGMLLQLARSQWMRDILLQDQTGVAALMVVGFMVLGVLFWFYTRYKKLSIGLLFFAVISQDTRAPVYHEIVFAIKYTMFIYLGVYGAIFFANNGWRILGAKYYRLLMAYFGWVAFVIYLKGIVIGNVWYLATDFIVIVALGMAWLSYIQTREDLTEFNIILSYVAAAMTFVHVTSPVWNLPYMLGGRFQSLFNGSTGFSHIYALSAITLFWRSMYETRPNYKRAFTVLAFTGFLLILASGTRAATVSLVGGIIILWWIFRTRILIYFVGVAFVALIAQIFLVGTEGFEFLASRMKSLENTRLEVWDLYLRVYFDNPVFGVSWAGKVQAIYGDIGVYVSKFRAVKIPSTHNGYLGVAVRWGTVGLVLYLSIYIIAAMQAGRVLFSKLVTMEDKRVYVMPAALLFMLAAPQLFEDQIGGSGRGNLHNLIFGSMPILLYVYGGRLLDKAREEDEQRRVLEKASVSSIRPASADAETNSA